MSYNSSCQKSNMIQIEKYQELRVEARQDRHLKSLITYPPISLIINPNHIKRFTGSSGMLDSQQCFQMGQGSQMKVKLYIIDKMPYFIYLGDDNVVLRSLLALSSHVVCYNLETELQTIIQTKWWEHKSLSHIYNIRDKTFVYFINERIKINKHLQGINYLTDQELLNTLQNVKSSILSSKQPAEMSLVQTCELLEMFVLDREYFKNQDFFTDRLNYIQLYKLQTNRDLYKDMLDKVSLCQDIGSVQLSLQKLNSMNKDSYQRKSKKLEVFDQIVKRQQQRKIFQQRRLNFKDQKMKPQKVLKIGKWQIKKSQYIQKFLIIILVILFFQVVQGHNLLSLAISLILAIFYLKFTD